MKALLRSLLLGFFLAPWVLSTPFFGLPCSAQAHGSVLGASRPSVYDVSVHRFVAPPQLYQEAHREVSCRRAGGSLGIRGAHQPERLEYVSQEQGRSSSPAFSYELSKQWGLEFGGSSELAVPVASADQPTHPTEGAVGQPSNPFVGVVYAPPVGGSSIVAPYIGAGVGIAYDTPGLFGGMSPGQGHQGLSAVAAVSSTTLNSTAGFNFFLNPSVMLSLRYRQVWLGGNNVGLWRQFGAQSVDLQASYKF